jgi:hypothetical protein
VSPRVKIFEGPTTTQPQAEASAEASPKLSYLEVERKILDSCIKGTKCAGEVGGRKVIRGWGDLVGSPEPITREVQDGLLSRKVRRVFRRRGKFFW